MADQAHDLERFVAAQHGGVFDQALRELQAGRKTSHWMWFVFPQLRGLGISSTAQFYGLSSLDEARAYLAHPILGDRLRECVDAVLGLNGRTVHEIFGAPDDMKFCSSMTLFELTSDGAAASFSQAIDTFCNGRRDPRTLELVGRSSSSTGAD
ncbi:DUF1810 domain-containing protein [Chenggangzhangella methanolivorans]|uniref:DUF1810 domain-containing protein n=1 Tax=Chenggangzhangella methanolivorans TaxID=1437009 RepID=A0A9E6ULZ7_9HYPH|nr:DUF1810 domain-containing protein [Chenggangzhangella methanolivorans]QZO01127.1 DUF1810 domain-containing protein [Chenggangzhangella methanolivorans]